MTHVSISEIGSFLRCRRQWDFTATSRQSLRPKNQSKTFAVGSAVHAALEYNALGKDWRDGILDYTGDLEGGMEEKDLEFTQRLSNQYFAHYGESNPLDDQGLRYVGSEVSFKIPLPIFDGDGEPINFVGTWDGVALDSRDRVWLIENKTAAKRADVEALQFNNQVVGYSWAFQVLTGLPVQGVLYNGVIKRLIAPPKQLKNGGFSTDKTASTTAQEFLKAVAASGQDPVRYLEYLEYLEAQGYERFFMREKIYPTQMQLENWGKDLHMWVRQMAGEPEIFPTRPWSGCGDCRVRDLCQATDRGTSVDVLISNKYKTETYATMAAIDRVEPSMVRSTDDLIDVLRGQHVEEEG